jgi:hypothetical protein
MKTCQWPIGNGRALEFHIHGFNASWKKVAGLYIFAYRHGDYWHPVYIGRTDDFSSRLPCHERLAEAVQNGATHIHARVVSLATAREAWEQQLIAYLKPLLNDRLKADSWLSRSLRP